MASLLEIFTWQETRRVTRALTLHYKRVMYVLDKNEAALQAMGKQAAVYETDDGLVSIRHDGRRSPPVCSPRTGV